jgi:hypothetical protein
MSVPNIALLMERGGILISDGYKHFAPPGAQKTSRGLERDRRLERKRPRLPQARSANKERSSSNNKCYSVRQPCSTRYTNFCSPTLVAQVIGNADDYHALLEKQRPLQQQRTLIM